MYDTSKIPIVDVLGLLVRNGIISTHEYYMFIERTSDEPREDVVENYELMQRMNMSYINAICNKQPTRKDVHDTIQDLKWRIGKLEQKLHLGAIIMDSMKGGIARVLNVGKGTSTGIKNWWVALSVGTKTLTWLLPLITLILSVIVNREELITFFTGLFAG